MGQHRDEQAAPLWAGHDPSHQTSYLGGKWEILPEILPDPVQRFQPLVAVSSLPFLARPRHKRMVIRMGHSRLSGLMDTTTC